MKNYNRKPPRGKKIKRAADLSDKIFDRLVEAIVTRKFPPGTTLREASIAKLWGVSRTPVRESVRKASLMGLVEIRPNQRPLIRQITSDEVEQLYTVREVLEMLALDLAFNRITDNDLEAMLGKAKKLRDARKGKIWIRSALKLDDDLHHLWIDRCGNPWLQNILQQLWTFIRILQQIVARDPAALQYAFQEHIEILGLLKAQDRSGTKTALRNHIRSSAKYLEKLLIDNGGMDS